MRTQGDINGLKAAQDKLGPLKDNATEKERADYMAELRNKPDDVTRLPAEIIVGDSLSMKYRQVLHTPMYFLGFWRNKLRRHWAAGGGKRT